MANAFTEYGIDLHWGLGATAVTVTNAIGIFQSIENELKIDEQEIRDQRGNVVTWIGYNPTQQATLEYYVADSGSTFSGSAPITINTSVPDRASMVSIGADGPFSGSFWIVQNVLIREENTSATKVTLKCINYPQIT